MQYTQSPSVSYPGWYQIPNNRFPRVESNKGLSFHYGRVPITDVPCHSKTEEEK